MNAWLMNKVNEGSLIAAAISGPAHSMLSFVPCPQARWKGFEMVLQAYALVVSEYSGKLCWSGMMTCIKMVRTTEHVHVFIMRPKVISRTSFLSLTSSY